MYHHVFNLYFKFEWFLRKVTNTKKKELFFETSRQAFFGSRPKIGATVQKLSRLKKKKTICKIF